MCILMLKYGKINYYIHFVLRYISFDVCVVCSDTFPLNLLHDFLYIFL